jgi:hypothetical protein
LYQVLALEASVRQVQPPAGLNDSVAANSPDTQPTPRASGPEPGEPTRLDQILRRLIEGAS